MFGVLLAKLTKFFQFQSVLQNLFVLAGKIICAFAFLALHLHHVVL